MKTSSVTESFERFLEMEMRSIESMERLQGDVRALRLRLEAEIEACNATLALCDEM